MRTTLTAVLVALAATLGLAGTAHADPDPAAVAAGLVNTPAGIIYVTALRPALTPAHQGDALSMVTTGVAICQGFDAGLTLQMVGGIAMSNGFSPAEAGAIMGAAVGAFCPQHEAQLHA